MYLNSDLYRGLMKMDFYYHNVKYFGMAVVERKRKMRGGWKRK